MIKLTVINYLINLNNFIKLGKHNKCETPVSCQHYFPSSMPSWFKKNSRTLKFLCEGSLPLTSEFLSLAFGIMIYRIFQIYLPSKAGVCIKQEKEFYYSHDCQKERCTFTFASTLAKTKREGLRSLQEMFQGVTKSLLMKSVREKNLQIAFLGADCINI